MNILLVEDNTGLAELVTVKLEECGFILISVASGAEALAHLKIQTPDMMLLDYSLPDMNAKELVETLNKQQIYRPPFIITTGHGNERIAVDMMKLGALEYLTKDSLFLEKLPDVVKRVIKEIESDKKLKQAEEALTENEVRFRAFMNASNNPTFIKDNHFRYLFANESTACLFNTTIAEIIGKTDPELAELIDIIPCQSSDERALESNEPFTIEEQLGKRIFEVTKLPLQLPNNKKGIGGIMQDITERVAAEEKLKESQERLRGFTDSATDGFMLFDSELNQIDINEAALKMIQQKREDVIGKNMLQLASHANKSGRYDKYKQVISTGEPVTFDDIIPHSKFGNKHVLLKAFKVGIGLGMIITDITDKVKSEQELKESEERSRHAITYAPYPIMIHAEGNVLQLSEEWTKQTGYTIDEIATIKEWTLKAYGKDAVPSQEFIDNLYKIDRTQYDGEWNVKTKDGRDLIWDFSSSPFGKLQNGKKMVISMASDITERKLAEEALRESNIFNETLLNTSPDIIYIYDIVKNKNIYSNDGITKTLGYSIEELQEMGNQIISQLMHPDDFKKYLNETFPKYQQLKDKELITHEYRMKHTNGDWYWLLSKESIFLRDTDGNPKQIFGIISDITERKKAKEKIRAAEENLKNTFDLSPSIIAKANLKTGYFTEANQAVTRILGYSVEEYTSKPFIDLIHPDDQLRSRDEKVEQLNGKDVTFFENRYVCKDGSYKWMAWYGTKADDNGIVTTIGSDITESKIAQLKLKQSNQLLEVSQSIAKLGGWELDIATNNLFWTTETYRIHDTSPEEFNPSVDAGVGYFLPDSRDMISKALKAAIENGQGYDLELETLTTKGRLINIRTTCEVTLLNGKPQKLTGIFQDITKRKQADEKIHSTEKNLKNTFDLSPSIIAKANLDTGYFIEVNQAVTRILGYSVGEFISKPFLELIHPDDRQKTTDKKEGQLEGKDVTLFENRYLCKNGSYKWIAWHGTKADDNAIVTAIGSDISERKIAEKELATYRENLEKLVRDRTKELEDKNKELDNTLKVFVGREQKIRDLEMQLSAFKGE